MLVVFYINNYVGIGGITLKNILLVEDDEKLVKYMYEYLSAYDYNVETIEDFNNLLGQAIDKKYDLILLDINLPKFDGFYYLKSIRNHIKTPIIIVSARSEEGEQIRGMDLGADDYVTKPFVMGILLAKIKAVLRRMQPSREVIKVKDISLCCNSLELNFNGKSIPLSKNEYKLLKLFFTNLSKVITREELLEELWDDEEFVDDNTLTVNITRLKKKIKEEGMNLIIETKRGIGYVLK